METTRPLIREHNSETNEVIDREMNDDEFNLYLKNKAMAEKEVLKIANKDQAKIDLLNKLGITEEEAKLLLN
jgi:hypothetical protein